jgi:mannose-6-phosphate isomerase-like protein (cupin superfamily)
MENMALKWSKIHEDDRGSINLIEGLRQYPEVTIFKTRGGYARGGCVHNEHDEFACVFDGAIMYYWGNDSKLLNAGDTIKIPRGSPHYFRALCDCVVAEWGASPEEKKVKHTECRAVVDKINKEMSNVSI